METSTIRIEHVGVLVVHGVGEQKRFETASGLARALAGTLAARADPPRFTLLDRMSKKAEQEKPPCPSRDRNDSPYEIQVEQKDGRRTHIHIHEVWWADLGSPDKFFDQLGFWVWALGQWAARIERLTHDPKRPSNTDKLMVGPKFPLQESAESSPPFLSMIKARSLLALAGFLAFLTFFSWNLVKRVLSWISPLIGSSSLITQYVGDVRTYTQGPAVGGGNLIDVGQPWRATIRRRMIAEFVAMAERRYNRWYLLGHSLGAVLAFNAVQEPEWSLPNYLELEQVERLRGRPLWTTKPFVPNKDPKLEPDLSYMMPRRPFWLASDEGISRRTLFLNFRGLLTYGAPLDKFATLWPRIVCLNKQDGVIPKEADWVNLVDATDPVGASLKAFSDPKTAWPEGGPTNYRVRASKLFLYAHIRYFQPHRREPKCDTHALLDELLSSADQPPGLKAAFEQVPGVLDPQKGRRLLAFAQLALVTFALALGSGLLAFLAKGLIDAAIGSAPAWMGAVWAALGSFAACLFFGTGYWAAVVFVIALAVFTVLVAGIYRWIREGGLKRLRLALGVKPRPPAH